MVSTAGQRHALIDCYGRHRRRERGAHNSRRAVCVLVQAPRRRVADAAAGRLGQALGADGGELLQHAAQVALR